MDCKEPYKDLRKIGGSAIHESSGSLPAFLRNDSHSRSPKESLSSREIAEIALICSASCL